MLLMHIVRSIIDLPYSHCPSASVHYHLSIPRGRRFFFLWETRNHIVGNIIRIENGSGERQSCKKEGKNENPAHLCVDNREQKKEQYYTLFDVTLRGVNGGLQEK